MYYLESFAATIAYISSNVRYMNYTVKILFLKRLSGSKQRCTFIFLCNIQHRYFSPFTSQQAYCTIKASNFCFQNVFSQIAAGLWFTVRSAGALSRAVKAINDRHRQARELLQSGFYNKVERILTKILVLNFLTFSFKGTVSRHYFLKSIKNVRTMFIIRILQSIIVVTIKCLFT